MARVRKVWHDERRAKANQMWHDGVSKMDIALACDVTVCALEYYAKTEGLPSRPVVHDIKASLAAGMTFQDMSKAWGSHVKSLRQRAVLEGLLPRRAPGGHNPRCVQEHQVMCPIRFEAGYEALPAFHPIAAAVLGVSP